MLIKASVTSLLWYPQTWISHQEFIDVVSIDLHFFQDAEKFPLWNKTKVRRFPTGTTPKMSIYGFLQNPTLHYLYCQWPGIKDVKDENTVNNVYSGEDSGDDTFNV